MLGVVVITATVIGIGEEKFLQPYGSCRRPVEARIVCFGKVGANVFCGKHFLRQTFWITFSCAREGTHAFIMFIHTCLPLYCYIYIYIYICSESTITRRESTITLSVSQLSQRC